ncbi:MAG: response regulator, partial [Lachnospiraceae bacterium]|nr:response regulator [Lachnospiraceae bacterium]
MDHMMPEMDGVETMKRMRKMECCDGVPIYVLTANAVTGAKDEYMAMGFDGFLSKPVAADKLNGALREAIPEEMIHILTEVERQELRGTEPTVSGPPEDLPDVDGLDWNWAWTHLPEREMLREGVLSFYEILDLQADSLEEFYKALPKSIEEEGTEKTEGEDRPLDAYRIQVHGMKSAAATIGIVPLAGTAKLLEFAAKDGNLKRIFAMHTAFIEEWRSYKQKLSGVFGLSAKEDTEEKERGDKELLLTMFELLTPAMEELDVDTADGIMDKMKSYCFGEEIDGLVGKLNAAVKNLDEDLAKELMEEMEQKL